MAPTALDRSGDHRSHARTITLAGGVSSLLLTLSATGQCPLSFSGLLQFSAGSQPVSAVSGDLDSDGHADLAVIDRGSPTGVSVLLGTGGSAFFAAVHYPAPIAATAFHFDARPAVVDFDGDGDLDLAVPGYANSIVSLLRNHGDGSFDPAITIPGGPANGHAAGIAAADFDMDGDMDFATANTASNTVSVHIGAGDLSFAAPIPLGVPEGPNAIHAADVNGDGSPDLVMTNGPASVVTVLLGTGDGSFSAPLVSPAGAAPFGLALADFDQDGDLDLATSNYVTSHIRVMLGNGNGTFGAPTSFVQGGDQGRHPVAADFNDDGKADIAMPCQINGTVVVHPGNGDGTLGPPMVLSVGSVGSFGGPYHAIAGDFNDDGRLDIAAPVISANTVAVFTNTHSNATMPTIVGQPTPTTIALVGSTVTLSAVADGAGADLTYQWRRNGVPLTNGEGVSGATSPALTLTSIEPIAFGCYDLQVKVPACGGGQFVATTAPAIVAVSVPDDCPADFNGDGQVDGDDLGGLLGAWGRCR